MKNVYTETGVEGGLVLGKGPFKNANPGEERKSRKSGEGGVEVHQKVKSGGAEGGPT